MARRVSNLRPLACEATRRSSHERLPACKSLERCSARGPGRAGSGTVRLRLDPRMTPRRDPRTHAPSGCSHDPGGRRRGAYV
jgi:hypothetical protein